MAVAVAVAVAEAVEVGFLRFGGEPRLLPSHAERAHAIKTGMMICAKEPRKTSLATTTSASFTIPLRNIESLSV